MGAGLGQLFDAPHINTRTCINIFSITILQDWGTSFAYPRWSHYAPVYLPLSLCPQLIGSYGTKLLEKAVSASEFQMGANEWVGTDKGMLYVDSKHRTIPGGLISFLNSFQVKLLGFYLPMHGVPIGNIPKATSSSHEVDSVSTFPSGWEICPSEHLATSPFYFQLSVWKTVTAYLPFPSCGISRTSRVLPVYRKLTITFHQRCWLCPAGQVQQMPSRGFSQGLHWLKRHKHVVNQLYSKKRKRHRCGMCASGTVSEWVSTQTKQLSRGSHMDDERITGGGGGGGGVGEGNAESFSGSCFVRLVKNMPTFSSRNICHLPWNTLSKN